MPTGRLSCSAHAKPNGSVCHPFHMSGRIVLAATPIGNVADASARLVAALASADVVAAEDTRRTLDLARALEVTITGKLIALHDHNERARADGLVAEAAHGATVLLVTD